jgi:hypothetical protein
MILFRRRATSPDWVSGMTCSDDVADDPGDELTIGVAVLALLEPCLPAQGARLGGTWIRAANRP